MYFIAKYIFILFCFTLCLIQSFPHLHIPQTRFLPCALFLTACADYFLIFTDSFQTGVLLFCLVQLCYRLFLGGRWLPLIKGSLAASLLLLPLAYFSDTILIPAFLYIGFLSSNIRLARTQKNFQLLLALTLMLLCDLHVGFANLPFYLKLPSSAWYSFSAHVFWFFYLPSQFLISILPTAKPSGCFLSSCQKGRHTAPAPPL